jgi:hypothetical protein
MQTHYGSKRFRILAALTLVATSSINGSTDEQSSLPFPLDDPQIVAAIRKIWVQSALGKYGIESSFRLDGGQPPFKVVLTPGTHQYRSQAISVIAGVTFAIFHVHTTRAEPYPSPADRAIADRHKVRVYTIHTDGLYEYDPITRKTVKVRDGIGWMTRSSTAKDLR